MFPKLCKECVHCIIPAAGIDYARCEHSATLVDLVTGVETKRFCDTERVSTSPSACGKQGRFFQLKSVEQLTA